MQEYNEKFKGRVAVKKICDSAKIQLSDLPYLSKFITQEGNMLCYNHVLGTCGYSKKKCRFKHVPSAAIPDDFARALCNKIEPGVQYLLRNGTPAPGGESR